MNRNGFAITAISVAGMMILSLWIVLYTVDVIDYEPQPIICVKAEPITSETPITIPEDVLVESVEDEIWEDSLEYLAMCVEAEAGNQTELGKRLVCDTVLNRYDSGKYESLYDVINEENGGVYQYSVVGDGRIYTVEPTEETYRIVAEELENRTNTEVLYFRTQHYHTFGTPLFQEDDHYFSKD